MLRPRCHQEVRLIPERLIPHRLIPDDKSAAVTRGLREAFGVTEFEDIRAMTKGHTTALVYRIVVRGSPFLLRIIMRPNAIIGPARHFTCMKTAADAGVAPHVWYTSLEDEISITDFVEEVPLPASEALVRMPAVLRTLHALSPFPPAMNNINTSCLFLMNDGPAVDGFIQRFKTANILPQAESEELFAWHAQLAAAYPHHAPDMVSSHNDLFKPDNTLFDGHRLWLVDWEAAFLNDRYADLAVVANLVVTNDTSNDAPNEAEEAAYLHEYFGQPPDEYQRARFFLARQVAHMFYAMVYLLLGSSGKPVDLTEKAPEFNAFHRRMWAGEINLTDNDTKLLFGRLHWGQLVQNMRRARYREALKIVSDRHPRS
jgi:aminoglycoside phosphotransferase (APT) family kinase protein